MWWACCLLGEVDIPSNNNFENIPESISQLLASYRYETKVKIHNSNDLVAV